MAWFKTQIQWAWDSYKETKKYAMEPMAGVLNVACRDSDMSVLHDFEKRLNLAVSKQLGYLLLPATMASNLSNTIW